MRYEQAPFDHPEIIIPIDGSAPDNTGGRAQLLSDTRFLRINAIGAVGRDQPLKSFLGISAIEGDPGPDHFDSVITTEPMSLHGFFPGVAATANKMTITGAVPGAVLGVVASTNLGSATINLACGSIDLGLLPPYRISGLVPADAFGNVSFTFAIPASLRGMTFHFQAVQPGTCLVSDISTTTF